MAELLLRRQHGEQLAEAKKAVAVNYRTSEPVDNNIAVDFLEYQVTYRYSIFIRSA